MGGPLVRRQGVERGPRLQLHGARRPGLHRLRQLRLRLAVLPIARRQNIAESGYAPGSFPFGFGVDLRTVSCLRPRGRAGPGGAGDADWVLKNAVHAFLNVACSGWLLDPSMDLALRARLRRLKVVLRLLSRRSEIKHTGMCLISPDHPGRKRAVETILSAARLPTRRRRCSVVGQVLTR